MSNINSCCGWSSLSHPRETRLGTDQLITPLTIAYPIDVRNHKDHSFLILQDPGPTAATQHLDPQMASSRGPMGLQPYGTRTQMMRVPPVPAASTSNSWTALYLVSPPLPAHVSVVQFDIISHDQGWCTNPQDGVWSWFEVSILASWLEDANPELHNLSNAMYLMSCPEDFGQMFQEQGLYFKDIPQERNESGGTGPSVISVPVARNTIQWDWQHHTVTWTRNGNNGGNGGFLPLLEEGDRLAIWARAQV